MKIGTPCLKCNHKPYKPKPNGKSNHGNISGLAHEALPNEEGIRCCGTDTFNPDLSYRNTYEGYATAESLIDGVNQEIQEYNEKRKANGERGLKSDAVILMNTLIKPDAEYMNSLPEDEQERFLQDAIDKVKEIVDEENVRSIAIHRDEEGLHAHIFWMPYTKDGRLSARDVYNLPFKTRLNKELPEHMRSLGWKDVQNCERDETTKAKEHGLSVSEYGRRKNKETNEKLEAKAEFLNERSKRQLERGMELEDREISVSSKEKELDTKASELQKRDLELKAKENYLNSSENALNGLRKRLKDKEDELQAREAEIALKGKLDVRLNALEQYVRDNPTKTKFASAVKTTKQMIDDVYSKGSSIAQREYSQQPEMSTNLSV